MPQRLNSVTFAVGPGPRPVPVLPDGATGPVDATGYSSRRNTLDACPTGAVPPAGFSDVAAGAQTDAVDCLSWCGVTRGTADGRYEPAGQVTGGQMATFLVRVLQRAGVAVPSCPPDAFPDDNGTTHELAANQLAALGVVGNFGDGTYRPGTSVRRDQMASFVHRAYAVGAGTPLHPLSAFADISGNAHEGNIQSLAGKGIVVGQDGLRYGPDAPVTRAQMAFFLTRTLDLLVEIGRARTP